MRRALLGLLIVLAGALAGCGQGDRTAATATTTTSTGSKHAGPPIRIGVKNFTEQAILGELYRQALEARGYEVELKRAVGSTEIIHRVLRRGVIDMYPEYVGVLLSEIAGDTSRPSSPAAALRAARAYERKAGFAVLAQTPFSDANALGVKPEFAERHRLRTIADLRRLPGTVRIAALPEFRTRYEGLTGLADRYGLRDVKVTAVDAGGRYPALDSGDVDVALVFTTEGQLAGENYVVLGDPRRLFASGHVAPIVNDETLAAHGPGLRGAIDAVTRSLTTTAMREMNAAVDLTGRPPAAVARTFLRARGLAR